MMFRPTTVVLLITAFCLVTPVVPRKLLRHLLDYRNMCIIYMQPCYCWIESENWKVYDFGRIGGFAYELGPGKRGCQRKCQRKLDFDGWMDEGFIKGRLCSLIDKTVRHGNLQLVSKLGNLSVSRRPIPYHLCCHKPTKCPMGHGMYKYDKKHNMCIRERIQGCIPRDPADDKTAPVCCLKSSLTGRFKTFDCQPAQNLRAKSVDCYATPGPPTEAQWHSTSAKPRTKSLKKDGVENIDMYFILL